jgi:hypothetical protein
MNKNELNGRQIHGLREGGGDNYERVKRKNQESRGKKLRIMGRLE